MPDLKFLVPGSLTVSRDASCTAVASADDGEECGRPSRFVVERSDGDESYGSGGGTEESCAQDLAATVLAMVNGDQDVRAVVTIRWNRGEAEDAAGLPLTCDGCQHAPATLLAAMGRTNADRTPAPGHVLRLLCGDCAGKTREIMNRGGRAVTFLAVGTEVRPLWRS